jgi:DNA-binding ferritin-like protein
VEYVGSNGSLLFFADERNGAIIDPALNMVLKTGRADVLSSEQSWSISEHDIVVPDSAVELAEASLSMLDIGVIASSGRKYTIPSGVQSEAKKALEWRKKNKRGGTPVGLNTARTLAKGGQIGLEKVRHIAKYFPRHEVDKKGKGYSPKEDGFPSNGRIAWALWGGDAGQRWASAIVESENKKAITADGYTLPTYEAVPDAQAYNDQYVGDINDFGRDDVYAPDFIARVRLDGSGIDRLYKIDDDGNVYVWDNGSWDDLGSMHGDIWARDTDLDGEDDYVEKTHVTIDPESAITIAALFQEDPFRTVSVEDLDDGEKEARMAMDALPEIDWNIVNLAMTAAGDTTKANAEYTPEERAKAAQSQVRNASGQFAKAGARVAVSGDNSKQGTITSTDRATGTVNVKLDDGSTVRVAGRQVDAPRQDVYPPTPAILPDTYNPLDLSGILGEPRTPMGRPIAQLPGTLPALTPADLRNLLADWPSWVASQRAQFKDYAPTDPVDSRTPSSSTDVGPAGRKLEKAAGQKLSVDAYKHPLLKNWLKKQNKASGENGSIWYNPITSAGDQAVELTPETTDVQPIYMAIVSPDDPRAVMQLSVLIPENSKSTAPMVWTREQGTWVKDTQTLSDLNSATPPPVVPLDETVLNDVLKQVDLAQAPEGREEDVKTVTASAYSLDFALAVLLGEKYDFSALVAAGGLDRNKGNAEELRKYWTVGKGGLKIRWGTGGDWTRCVRNLKKYLGARSKGYCALRHKEMNGVWPGDKRNRELSYQEPTGRVFSTDVLKDSDEMNTLMVLSARRQDAIDKVNFIAGRTNTDLGYSPETDLLLEDMPLTAAVDGETCPPATQNIELNLKNRQNAIDNVGYGPLNPMEPNDDFWQEKADKWKTSPDEAKKSVCGNCVFFIRTPQMLDCISTGIEQGGSQEIDADAAIDQAELGYCEALDFKCAASRTCNAWAVGGPITATAGSKPAPKKDQIKGSDKNKKGSAGTGKGVTFTDAIEKALSKKVTDHNAKADTGRKANLRTLKAVYRRGAGAFSTSHRPGQNRNSWAMARVNAYLHLLKTGSPKNSKYTTDNDLLPASHPKSSKGEASAMTAGGHMSEGARFYIPLVIPEGMESGDGRMFTKGAIELRELPLPLLWQYKTGDGHDGSVVVGRIDHMERVEGGIGNAFGVFDTGAYGREAERLVRNGFISGVSADMDRFEAEEDEDKEAAAKDSGKKKIKKSRININKARVMAVTIVPKPAFQECKIYMPDNGDEYAPEEQIMQDGIYTDEVDPQDAAAIMACGLVASAIPVAPPKDWFTDPKLGKATPLTVDDEGRVFGHIASWSTSHIGLSNGVKPPRSKSKYGYFHTGVCRTAEGADIPVGQLTLAGGHASLYASAADAIKHYDDTASAVADVHAGEDRYGIWVSGALRPGVQPEQIRTLRASAPSGDWRPIGGSLELVAVCQVNVPGFPIARAMVASGQVTALVAAGAATLARMKADPMADLNSRIAKLEKLTLSDKISELTARVKGAEFNYSYVEQSESNSYSHGNIALADTLKDLLADVVAFAHRAHGHHWNVEGANFPEYHRLFGKIYEDVSESTDPIAESIRTLGHVAPFDVADFANNTDIENRPLKDAKCQTMAYDLTIGNGILIDKMKMAFEVANSSNQQGIANMIGGRIEAHQKWQWQLMVSVSPHYEEQYSEGHEYYDGQDAYMVYETVFADLNKSGVLEAVVASVESDEELVESFDAVMQFAEFSPMQRKNLAKKGEALPDGSYPIRNEGDLKNAIKAYGRAKESERGEVKKHIIKRARALKKSDLIPEKWIKKSLTASADLERMREKIAEFGNLGAVSETDPKKAFSGIATSQLPLELSNEEFEVFASTVDAELEKLVKKVVPVSEQEIDRAISEVDQPAPAPAPAPQTQAPAEGQEIVAPSGEVNVEVEKTPMVEDGKYVPGKTQPRDVQGRFRLVLARLKSDLGTSGNQDVIEKIAEAENLIGNVGDYAGAVKSASELISTIDRLDSGALNAKSVENVRATTTELGRTIANLPLPFENQATKVRFSDLPATLKSLAKDLITRVEDKIGKEEADIATKELRGFMSGNDVYNQGEVSSQFNRLLRLLT